MVEYCLFGYFFAQNLSLSQELKANTTSASKSVGQTHCTSTNCKANARNNYGITARRGINEQNIKDFGIAYRTVYNYRSKMSKIGVT